MRRAYELIRNVDFVADFRIAANLGCACAALVFLSPFAYDSILNLVPREE